MRRTKKRWKTSLVVKRLLLAKKSVENDYDDDHEEDDEEDDEEEYCPMCGDEIDVASNRWGGGSCSGDYYCVPCYSDVLEGRKTFPQL